MRSSNDKLLYARVYMILSVLVPIIGFYIPNIWYFLGAASITESFLYAVGSTYQFAKILCLSWTIIAPILLIWFYVLFILKNKQKPFKVFMVLDLIVSALIRVLLVYRKMDVSSILIWGFVCRVLYFVVSERVHRLTIKSQAPN